MINRRHLLQDGAATPDIDDRDVVQGFVLAAIGRNDRCREDSTAVLAGIGGGADGGLMVAWASGGMGGGGLADIHRKRAGRGANVLAVAAAATAARV